MTIYQCSDWTFSPDSQEIIYSDERSEQLPTRLNNCLLILISSRGSTVSYEELLLKVWGTTHKDSSTISSVISEVRKLVGCGKGGKKVIVTVPKRGYRFTQLVDVIEDEQLFQDTQRNQQSSAKSLLLIPQADKHFKGLESVNTGAEPVPKETSSNRNQWVWLVIIVLLAASLLAFNLLKGFSNNALVNKTDAFSFSDYEVISHEKGSEDEFDVSKDSQWLIYVNKAPNVTSSLIVQNLSTGRKQTLTASGENYFGSPVFSYNAKQIVFHKQTAKHCEVWLADFSTFNLESSKTKKLTNCGKGGFWSTTAFSRDGKHIFFSRANNLTDPFKLYRLDLRTLFERSITSPTSSGRGDYAFSLSPDGKRLAVVRNLLWQESHILLNNTIDNQSQSVIELPYLIDRVGWLSNDLLVYCDKNERLWSYDLVQKKQTQLAQISFSCHYPVVASEQLYAIKKVRTNNAIWALKKNANDEFVIQPLITSPYYDYNAMFGPNNSLYFISDRSGEKKLWQQTEQGFVQHKSVGLPEHARELEFSVKTNTLYGLSEKRLFRYDLNLGELEWLSHKKHEVFNFSISDDEKLIFSEGNNEYWVLKSLDLFTLKITELNINSFSARQYNNNLYFTKFHEKGLWKKDLLTGQVEKIFKDINIKFNTFWDIWNNDTLIWATDNRFKVFDLNTGELLNDKLTYEGHVGFLKCNKDKFICTFSFKENNESEIIKFK